MQISARSYLTAGISLTAASAIALAPLAIPANERAVSIPQVTISDIQLTVTPADITAFFNQLQGELSDINASIATVVGIPGQTLLGGLDAAIDLNERLYAALRSSTTNPTLLALFDALEDNAIWALDDLAFSVDFANDALVLTTKNITDLLTGALTGSLSTVLAAVVDVANNPLSFAKYAGLLGAGIGAGQLIAGNGIQVVRDLSDAGFDFASAGIWAVQDTINNAIWTVRDIADVAAGATGIDLIEAVNNAVQSILIAPVQLGINVPFDVASDALDAVWLGLDTALVGVKNLVNITGGSLQQAIGAVGAGPLNPESYLVATAVLLAGGFSGFNTAVQTIGGAAQIPFDLGTEVTLGLAGGVIDVHVEIAEAISGVLAAVGLPPALANLPLAVADGINEVIAGNASVVADGLDGASAAIQLTTTFIVAVSNEIEDAIFGIAPAPEPVTGATLDGPAEPVALKVAAEPAGDPSDAVVLPADETPEDQTVEETTPVDPETVDPETVDPATGSDDTTGSDDSTESDDTTESDDASDKAERTERAAKKAERESKSDSDSDKNDSDSDSTKSDSDKGDSNKSGSDNSGSGDE